MGVACGGHAPAIADLEGDGEVEVVVGPLIFRGANGALRFQGSGDSGRYMAYAEMGFNSIIVDLEGDGNQEIIAGRSVYNFYGQEVCKGDGTQDGFTAAADLDLDGQGEFIVVGNQTATIYDTDCSILKAWALQGGGTGGPPTIADYDGDRAPEIGLVDAATYTVYEPDGSVLWSAPVTDMSSHATGSLVFDFEGDGLPEVVYADELSLWVFDGQSGTVRLQDAAHNSRTLHEYPTVADIDGDGSAEIIVINGGSHYNEPTTGIFVIGSESNGWQRGRQVWNQHAYNIVNINEDLSIPVNPMKNWPTYNNFRSGDLNPLSGAASADAIPIADPCFMECYLDKIYLHLRIGNTGAAALRYGIPISVYAQDGTERTLLGTYLSEEILEPGYSTSNLLLALDPNDIPNGELVVIVDEPDYVTECTEDNNTIVLTDIACPE
ncbi:MAG: FG-GAP repeat domain-containing protein [Myxococcota bacterium]